ncbi:hypothetical protein AB2B38_008570 [Balneola sp. MJW-20]|uniref:hypothetical protein n=1 Tax=Gracilimonas aurantiaca TaxID=3234185 RepID=UPI0034653CD1
MKNQLLLRKYYLLERLKEGGYPDKAELREYVSNKIGHSFDHIQISDRVIERDLEFLRTKLFQSIQYSRTHQGYVYNESESLISDVLNNFFLIVDVDCMDEHLSKAG